jgi:probable blue pigment (indigoidine) exporter
VLLPVGLLVEGAPPTVDAAALGGFLWLGVLGTAVAYVCWFHGLTHMPAGAVSLIGLLNPVVGTTLGVLVAGELFGAAQAVGMVLVLGGVLAGQPAVAELIRRRGRGRGLEPMPENVSRAPDSGIDEAERLPAA